MLNLVLHIYLQVWAGPLSGNRLAIALWNRCSKVATITASWASVGLESGIHVSVRDLWQVSLSNQPFNLFSLGEMLYLFVFKD